LGVHLGMVETALVLEHADVVFGHDVAEEALMHLLKETEGALGRLNLFHGRIALFE
jgi:hypothetical protein